MTVFFDENEEFFVKKNEIKEAIKNNDPIEDVLNVIIVISNPCLYRRRYVLLKEFVKRFEDEENVRLFIVELIYKNQEFVITEKDNKQHLQIKTEIPIWHKENMINLGVKYLLPKDWKAFAWVDADLEFDSSTWALDTLKVLNGCKDIIQLFSNCIDMDRDGQTLNIFNGFGYSYANEKKYTTKGLDYWHPGYAWAITRKAYEKIEGLYDKGILGSGDSIMALGLIGKVQNMFRDDYHPDYHESMITFQEKCKRLRLGYIPGVIKHHYHGSKQNRKYTERWKILMKYQYSPKKDLVYDKVGILTPSKTFSEEFKDEILNYFKERKEDE